MPAQCVTGPIAFSMSLDPIYGSNCTLSLTADGTHTPTFTGFTEASSSAAWNDTAGVVNVISFSWAVKASGPTYSISVPSTTPIPAIASLSVPHGANPTLTITTNGAALSTAYVPAPPTFKVTRAATFLNSNTELPVSSVSLSANQIQLVLSGIIGAGDSVSLSYTPTFPGQSPYPISAQDASGNLLAAITAASVTVS